VSGGAIRAANGTLSIMAGGTNAAIDNAKPILETLSDQNKLFLPGPIGAGSNLKMVHQVLAAIQILATSEAMAFATWLGLDLERTREKVLNSSAYSWMFENRSPRILKNAFAPPPPSALTIIIKDVVRQFPSPSFFSEIW
jgi:3-hydroxyisobutyrate dehydrogenase